VLNAIRRPDLQPVSVPCLSVQSLLEAQHTRVRGVQLEVAVVPGHQTVSEVPQRVRVTGSKRGHHLSSRKVLGHGVLQWGVAEGRWAVVSVQNSHLDLQKSRVS
jgi:hypothetical protein